MQNNAAALAGLYSARIDQAASMAAGTGRARLIGKMQPMSEQEALKVGKDFESMFVAQMLEPMFGDSLGDDLFGGEDTDEIYKGLMVEEYGKLITQSGGIGIADHVKKELLALQEAGGSLVEK